jgi:DNA-binding NarL/FixJ family response regulator
VERRKEALNYLVKHARASEVLGRAPALRCVGTHPNGEEALREIPPAQPDVVLMDIHLHTRYEKLHVQSRTQAVVKFLGQA